MTSICSFFASLLATRQEFRSVQKLEDFPFDNTLLSCRNRGSFPDLILRLDQEGEEYFGGELIELKDSRSYSVASFNSTIPSGTKNLADLISSPNSQIFQQIVNCGEDPFRHPIRDVYYLIRGRRQANIKVCLVHGSFFETVDINELIHQSLEQVIREGLGDQPNLLDSVTQNQLIRLLSHQAYFRKTRDVPNASVKLRFRVMTEVKREGNILNPDQYPQFVDNSFSLVLPCPQEEEMDFHSHKLRFCVPIELYEQLAIFTFRHPLNGLFVAFQIPI